MECTRGGGEGETELFFFIDNCVFESVFFEGTPKRPLFFESALHLHKIYMKVLLILHVVHLSGTRMIESGIYVLSRGNDLGGIIQDIDTLNFIPLYL